jgi:tetratricopeptide (TPR) repeat protein
MSTNLPTPYTRLIWVLILISVVIAITALLAVHDIGDLLRLNAGYIRLNQGLAVSDPASLDSSEQTLEQIGRQSPLSPRARRGIGLAYMNREQFAATVEQWIAYDDAVNESMAWAFRAERLGDWATAEQWHRLSVEIDPGNGDHWYRLAQVSGQLGRNIEAADHYLAALNSPTHSDIGRSTILMRLAEMAKRAEPRDWTEVHLWYDRALDQDEFTEEREEFQARMGRAEALDNMGHYNAALEDYRWVADRLPRNYWANLHTGRLLWQVEQDAAAAERYLLQAIERDPTEKWGYRALALVFAQTGQEDQAIELYQTILSLDPNDEVARERLHQLININEP